MSFVPGIITLLYPYHTTIIVLIAFQEKENDFPRKSLFLLREFIY